MNAIPVEIALESQPRDELFFEVVRHVRVSLDHVMITEGIFV
jgi:hypothetical protein